MKEVISKELIHIKYDAKDWEDAVTFCGNLLERAGYVKPAYVQAMVNTVKALGAYIVIAPGLAMPHARESDGVLKSGISIVTLKKPIDFGNKDHDPVYLLIGLAGKGDDRHMDMMAAIANIFEDESMVYKIASWDDPNQIAEVFYGKEEC